MTSTVPTIYDFEARQAEVDKLERIDSSTMAYHDRLNHNCLLAGLKFIQTFTVRAKSLFEEEGTHE